MKINKNLLHNIDFDKLAAETTLTVDEINKIDNSKFKSDEKIIKIGNNYSVCGKIVSKDDFAKIYIFNFRNKNLKHLFRKFHDNDLYTDYTYVPDKLFDTDIINSYKPHIYYYDPVKLDMIYVGILVGIKIEDTIKLRVQHKDKQKYKTMSPDKIYTMKENEHPEKYKCPSEIIKISKINKEQIKYIPKKKTRNKHRGSSLRKAVKQILDNIESSDSE